MATGRSSAGINKAGGKSVNPVYKAGVIKCQYQ
jgi:hypothetical protein